MPTAATPSRADAAPAECRRGFSAGPLESLHALGNEVRLALLNALLTLHRGKLFVEMGSSSFSQYCDRELGLAHSTDYEYLRAGMALAGLPRLRVFFSRTASSHAAPGPGTLSAAVRGRGL